jgi:hypothetical protein
MTAGLLRTPVRLFQLNRSGLGWRILPPGHTWKEIIRHYESLQSIRHEEYDASRLKFTYDLKPDDVYVGVEEFEGYVVFVFQHGQTAVLECPKVGNAIYLMDAAKWKFLSQLSKTELLEDFSNVIERVPHVGFYWRLRLKRVLRRRGVLSR